MDTLGTDITNPTEHIFLDEEMDDTEYFEGTLLDMSEVTSLTRQARQDREGGGRKGPPRTGPL